MSNPEMASQSSVDDHVGNLTAVDAISERLAEVTRLAEKLDERLYEAGARIRNASRQLADQVNETSSSSNTEARAEEKKPDMINDTKENFEKIDNNEIDESYTEDYVTATECTTTPMARSRSESFVTMSECDDGGVANEFGNPRQDVTTETRGKQQEFEILNTIVVPEEDKLIVSRSLDMSENTRDTGPSGPDVERTNSTSIVEKVEEKLGMIVKEVTETTTLRVSHNTRFGIASYKLSSNTLREAHEHTDVKGILDLKGFGAKSNGFADDQLSHKDDFTNYNREELTLSNVDATPYKSENTNNSKFMKMIRESSQREEKSSHIVNENNNVIKSVSFGLETRGNNDSGIEMTPRKNDDYLENKEEPENLEILRKLKTVSRSQVVVDNNSTLTSLRTIH